MPGDVVVAGMLKGLFNDLVIIIASGDAMINASFVLLDRLFTNPLFDEVEQEPQTADKGRSTQQAQPPG